ncbi:uncharacterized protein KY384_000871 [Bacidia gigantensis]|uniref:uncharacterized protein n=1 Tax=Bacidia gigantensis TaxID=2732470 RepID=UPI001D038E70|nr:uncharacterized protein KY384_000871 [Bacidia gigantensis]KAG8534028.1 hypothetical protein KY384_000871 [Bacidia gigantensis]
MFNRGFGDSRRKVLLLLLLGGILILSFVGFRKHDEIGDIIQNQRQSWKNTTSYTYQGSSDTASDDEALENSPSSFNSEYKKDKKLAGKTSSKSSKQSHKQSEPEEEEEEEEEEQEPVAPGPVFDNRKLSSESLIDLRNDTLGFEHIYVLNMAGRTDKLDAMRLSASLSNFSFDIMEGVSGAEVPKKAVSGIYDYEKEGINGVIGCWRGHMNFARTIIRKKHASALIMEDDADWDVDFRNQLERFALGSQTLLNTPHGEADPAPDSPYGDGWDLLWLGHCGTQPLNGSWQRFLIKNDPTTTPLSHRVNFANIPDMSLYPNNTRIVMPSKGATCTYSYALSYHGAQKIMKWMSMDVYAKPVDFGLHDMCSEKERGFKCFSIFPQIIADHKPPGGANKDSDIGEGGKASNVRKKGFSYNVVNSVRINADALIDGRLEDVESQWPGEDDGGVEGEITYEYKDEEVEDVGD